MFVVDVPFNTEVISSHTVYKIKTKDYGSLHLKVGIACNGNKTSLTHVLQSECAMYSQTGIRFLLIIVAITTWVLTKEDVKSAFIQYGHVDRDFYVHSL